MNLNATLLGQMITFLLFVWFAKAFVWPPIIKALKDRQGKIADGLAAAEKGHASLATAQQEVEEMLSHGRQKVSDMVVEAEKKADKLIDEARQKAHEEGHRIIQQAQAEIEHMVTQAKTSLQEEVANIALFGAQKVLEQGVDATAHQNMLNKLVQAI